MWYLFFIISYLWNNIVYNITIINVIIFFIKTSKQLLLYKKTIFDYLFCDWPHYWILPLILIVFAFLKVSWIYNHIIWNNNNYFFSISSIYIAYIFRTIIKNSDDCNCPSFVPSLNEKVPSFSRLIMMLAITVCYKYIYKSIDIYTHKYMEITF